VRAEEESLRIRSRGRNEGKDYEQGNAEREPRDRHQFNPILPKPITKKTYGKPGPFLG